jgi:hypothetical protein
MELSVADLIDKLDELAGKAKDGTVGPAAFLYALRDAWPALRDRLKAAEKVCEAAEGYRAHKSPSTSAPLWDALAAWRRTLEGASDE